MSTKQPASKKMRKYELQRNDTVSYIQKEDGIMPNTVLKPLSTFVTPLLTDLYQITMAYSLWKNKLHDKPATFDLFFRKNPFQGEYTIFAGLEEVVRFVSSFQFKPEQVQEIKNVLPAECDPGFFEWLGQVTCSDVKLYALKEGTVAFPRIPLIIVEGPLAVCQLLETTLLNLVNFPSLVATNAARHRIAIGKDKTLLEFGLRRAQGPDGALSASRYSYLGGADGTSNVLAHSFFGIPVRGTHAHSFVTAFNEVGDMPERSLRGFRDGADYDLWLEVTKVRKELKFENTNEGELIAFTGIQMLMSSCATITKHFFTWKAIGVRLDSGDLAYLSKETRKIFVDFGQKYNIDYFKTFQIVASNDLNEQTILSLIRQGHEIDVFAVGTNLVTCQAQPALGCVYKMVEINKSPRIKLSQEAIKVTLPGRKFAYRLYSSQGYPLVDVLIPADSTEDEIPQVKKEYLCRHPFEEQKRVKVIPSIVEPLHHLVWDGKVAAPLCSLEECRALCQNQLSKLREDHLRQLNPTPYKVSVNEKLYQLLHDLLVGSTPVTYLQ